jgi:branched-chain amino acid transport system substrate-binding protein
MPLTGVLGPVGKQATAGAKLYVAQHGTTVAGKKIELIIKDDSGVPDNAKRLAQELVVNDKVSVIGAGITPASFAVAPIVTEGKVATVIMVSGTSIVTERSRAFSLRSLRSQTQICTLGARSVDEKNMSLLSISRPPGRLASPPPPPLY